jgi:histidyl-tRNA synthetase
MRELQAPKGVSEYFPPRSYYFEFVRQTLIDSAKISGYQLMELPVFEDTELFRRGVGESTDVVSKEMYTFDDRGGRSLTLRPEGTAGVMRSVIEHNLDKLALPIKVWYSGAFFRAERPQAGRYRQFYQVGIEAIGLPDPEIDFEVIAIADRAFKS